MQVEAEQKRKHQTRSFDADIQELMNIIVNAFYSNKDVFLRELISNASDAMNKHKFAALTNESDENTEKFADYKIKIKPDKKENTLVIEDNGIGMNESDLQNCLGTIAKSGTKSFIEVLKNSDDMIGQFGVGFYSAFLVADRVTVLSRRENGLLWAWESDGKTGYTTYEKNADETDLKHGTQITLHLKKDESTKKYLEEEQLTAIIEKHSQFVSFPIYLWSAFSREVEVENADAEEEKDDDDSKPKVEDVTDDDEEPEKPKVQTQKYYDWAFLNKNEPLWTKNTDEVTSDQYEEFYKTISKHWTTYSTLSHFKMEGNVEFTALLFFPERATSNLFQKEFSKRSSVKLYVKRVLITDECSDLLPDWLSFVTGIVDSYDLPLNVSREILQDNKFIPMMKKHLVKKCISALDKFAESSPVRYDKWYSQFGKFIKLGVHEEKKNTEKIANLLRYNSTTGSNRSLSEYIENMRPDQPGIYYLTGESEEIVSHSPYIEKLRQKGYEVLYLVDPMDEYMIQKLKKFKDKHLLPVTSVKLEGLDENEVEDFSSTCVYCKQVLGNSVGTVVVSKRIVESPSCIVTAENTMSANMERIMKAQALSSHHQFMFDGRKTLEINPLHKIVLAIHSSVKSNTMNKHTEDLVRMLFDTAILTSGFSLEKPHEFTKRIHRIIEANYESTVNTVKKVVKEVAEKVEEVAEVVEKAANETEKVAEVVEKVAEVAGDTEVVEEAKKVEAVAESVASTAEKVEEIARDVVEAVE